MPEHGAALRGDKMQIAGMREIPTPAITLVPVGIKVIGQDANRAGSPVQIDTPILAVPVITTPLEPANQALFALALFACALVMRRVVGRGVTLFLVVISILASTRYLWWRLAYTMNGDDPWGFTWGAVLLMAEFYAWLTLLLGYFQSAWPLNRRPAPLPDDRDQWPTVDVYTPTYNEPLTVVAPTVIAALAMDWPRAKLQVFLLDDGRRDAMRQFAAEVGAQYITRPDSMLLPRAPSTALVSGYLAGTQIHPESVRGRAAAPFASSKETA